MEITRPLLALSILIGVVLILLSLVQFAYDVEALPAVGVQEAPASGAIAGLDMEARIRHLSTIRGRPLFHSTRRAFQKPAAAPAPEASAVVRDPLEHYELKGIVFKRQGDSVVYLRNRQTEQQYRLAAGDAFGQWRVVSIGRSTVDVTNDVQSSTLTLLQR